LAKVLCEYRTWHRNQLTFQCSGEEKECAMERVVTVNGPDENRSRGSSLRYDPHPTAPREWSLPSGSDGGEDFPGEPADPLGSSKPGKWGTCLYLGPGGERCGRPALATGYCARHQGGVAAPTDTASATLKRKRTLGAIVGLIGVLWPILASLFRELFRWLHSH